MSASLNANAVEIRQLCKTFGSHDVLKHINLAFARGEIHAFLGANGAGKSTLLGCLSGAVKPSAGAIVVRGQAHATLTPRLARELGISIIYQHFQVVEGLSVVDNIFLGSELKRWGVVDRQQQTQIARTLLARLGVALDPHALLDRLSVGERQIVEIARALHQQPDVLILDEPTAALSEREVGCLHQVVRQLAKQENLAIVYVTHLLDEVAHIADKVTVLRDGEVIWTRAVRETSSTMIAQAIAPDMAVRSPNGACASKTHQPVVLQLQHYQSAYTGPVNLSVHAGEIVGVYGLLGSGRSDLLESLAGARAHVRGTALLEGKPIAPHTPREALDLGLALVASDRNAQSLFGELAAIDNLLMPHLTTLAGGQKQQHQLFADSAQQLRLQPNQPQLPAARFSGGNAQKLVMGRWLLPDLGIKVLLLDEPTQGVDIGARAELYGLLRRFAATGGAILLASSDPDEMSAVADRVLILAHGRPVEIQAGDIREDRLIQAAHKTAAGFAPVSTHATTHH